MFSLFVLVAWRYFKLFHNCSTQCYFPLTNILLYILLLARMYGVKSEVSERLASDAQSGRYYRKNQILDDHADELHDKTSEFVLRYTPVECGKSAILTICAKQQHKCYYNN